jgi:hypothetical protein
MTVELQLDDDALNRLADAVAERLARRRAADDDEDWVGVERAAERYACKRKRLYNLKSEGRLDGAWRKDGSRLLFKLSALDECMARNGEA